MNCIAVVKYEFFCLSAYKTIFYCNLYFYKMPVDMQLIIKINATSHNLKVKREIDMQQKIPKCFYTAYTPETIWKSKMCTDLCK